MTRCSASGLVALGLALASPAHAEPRDLADFILGFNAHAIREPDLPLLQAAGIGRLRIDLGWRYLADERGVVQPDHPGLKAIVASPAWIADPLVILEYGHPAFQNGGRPSTPEARRAFVDYAAASAEQLHAKTRFFEVWNEWNVPGMGRTPLEEGAGRPEDYAVLLRETCGALKKRFPDLVILGGAMAGIGTHDDYLPRAIRAGILDSLDGLSIHPYFYGLDDPQHLPEVAIPKRIAQVAEWLKAAPGRANIPLYVTELGWPTYGEHPGVTEEEQADFMARSILLLATYPRVKGVWLYEFRDSGHDPGDREHHFGVIRPDGTPKPAYRLTAEIAALLAQARTIERVTNASGDSIVTIRCEMKDGSISWVCWTLYPGKKALVSLRPASARPGAPAQRTVEAGARPVIIPSQSGWEFAVEERE